MRRMPIPTAPRAILVLALIGLSAAKAPDRSGPAGVFQRLGPPAPNTWRARHDEPGETAAEFQRQHRPISKSRDRIYIQPWLTRPEREPGDLRRIARFLGEFYGREAVILPSAKLPAGTYATRRRQCDAIGLARALAKKRPADAVLMLGVTDRDLFAGNMSYLLGFGANRGGVAVMSLARLDVGPDPLVRRRRILTLAAHETGHALGMAHCVFFKCLMNGAQTPVESDHRPAHLCPVCEAKLGRRLGLPTKHYRQAGSALAREGLLADAARANKVAAALARTPRK